MVRLHLKRTSMPKSWNVKRKNITFISKPNPGSFNRKYITSFLILIRDILKVAKTTKEAKYIVNNTDIFVNSKKIKEIKAPIGFFDTIEFAKTKEKFILLFDKFGKFRKVDIKDDNLYLKLKNKKNLGKSKFQLNFENSFNILVNEKDFKKAKTQDTYVYNLKSKKIEKIIELKEKSLVYIFDGNYKGKFGKVVSFNNYSGRTQDTCEIEIDGVKHITAKKYLFVVDKIKFGGENK